MVWKVLSAYLGMIRDGSPATQGREVRPALTRRGGLATSGVPQKDDVVCLMATIWLERRMDSSETAGHKKGRFLKLENRATRVTSLDSDHRNSSFMLRALPIVYHEARRHGGD